MADRHGFLAELKRRNVWRAAALYAGAAWALSQGVAQLGPAFGMPEWGTRWFVIACIIGFPFWLVFAWFYELTPHGFKRESEVPEDAALRHSNARRLDFAIIGVLMVALALLGSAFFVQRGASVAAIPAKSIAVLPFENLSDDKANDYFVSGMQDLILTKLADIGDLKVISRTSTRQYKSRPGNLKQIAGELGVATILEGSVQKAGNQVLINLQLIDTKTDTHLWAQTYKRTLDDIFGVEGEVAEKVAAALRAKLSGTEVASLAVVPTNDKVALDWFLQAEYQAGKGDVNLDPEGWKAAIPLYREAVKQDPKFALAWARLSIVENALAFMGNAGMDVKELVRQTGADAARALALQPDLAAAHLAMGWHEYLDMNDHAAAQRDFAEALRLRPNYADALAARGYLERREGRFDAALASLQQAVALDPRNAIFATELGVMNMMLNRFGEAEDWLRRALALDPDNVLAGSQYGRAILLGTGDVPRAWQALQGDAPMLKHARVELLTRQRRYVEALQLLDDTPEWPVSMQPGRNVSRPLLEANLHRLSGDAAQARPLFERELAITRSQLANQRGINLAWVWINRANAELGLGHTQAGLDAIATALAITDKSGDHFYGPLIGYAGAALYAQAGRAGLAVPLLSTALASPGVGVLYSPILLWLDPAWDPIRRDPDFQALLEKYANFKPAVTYPIPPHSEGTAEQPSIRRSRAEPAPECACRGREPRRIGPVDSRFRRNDG